MKLTQYAQNKGELFNIQKALVKTISLAAAVLIFISGAAIQYFSPNGTMGLFQRLIFVSLFGISAYFASQKKSSYRLVEALLAFAGSAFLVRMLVMFYESNLAPNHIIVSTLAVVGLSGVFIYKSSLVIINIPSLAFIFYTSVQLPQSQHMPASLALICLLSASTVGYFLTWQKVFLINKSMIQEAHKNTVISNLQEGVMLLDHTGRALTLNHAICQIIGLTADEIINSKPLDPKWIMLLNDGVTPIPRDKIPTVVARTTGTAVKNFPLVIKKPDHSITFIEMTANPIFSNTDTNKVEFVLTTCRDVSELKKAQDVIEHQKIQTLAHSKLTALGEMAAGIAHEINNPLTIILGRVDAIKRQLDNNSLTTQDISLGISKIEATTIRISKIVKSMKSLSRENLGDEFVRTNFKGIIDDIITVSGDNLKQNEITIETNIDAALELDCNSGLLSQVFINLMNNSVDAIKKQDLPRWIRIEATTDYNIVKIAFKDSGPGIPPVIKDKIMLPFFTTKEAGKGTGVGLSLCRTIIENHHGRFYVDDSCHNTSFIVEVPMYQTRKTPPISSAA